METAKVFMQFLQLSITPVALISGVGLILLSLTNRLGRTIDRSRALIHEYRAADENRRIIVRDELKILNRRNRFLKLAMAGISFSILTSSLLIPVLLIMNYMHINLSFISGLLLVLSIGGIILSSIYLFADVALSLRALDYEMNDIEIKKR